MPVHAIFSEPVLVYAANEVGGDVREENEECGDATQTVEVLCSGWACWWCCRRWCGHCEKFLLLLWVSEVDVLALQVEGEVFAMEVAEDHLVRGFEVESRVVRKLAVGGR